MNAKVLVHRWLYFSLFSWKPSVMMFVRFFFMITTTDVSELPGK
jgi:hypothetical protein